mgnify:CR=1 FL=1
MTNDKLNGWKERTVNEPVNKGRKNKAGADLTIPEGYSDDELLSLFNEFNTQLHIVRATGEDVGDKGENFDEG